jgi:ADP-dependent NAD(P)H-hydrate dehydratase / NAD(P)H-hydrate epimerase
VNGKRWLLVSAILGALLLGAAAIALLVLLPRYVERKVLSTAEAQGVSLTPEDISFGWGWVQITQVKVTLDKVRTVEMQIGRIDVALDGTTPLSIDLTNVDGLVVGSITNVGLELSEWTKSHPSAYSLPLSAKNVHVRFVEPAGTPPWLEVSGGELTRTKNGGVFAAQHTRFVGVDLGTVGAGFAQEASTIALGFGEADLSKAPFRVEVSPSGATPSARFVLAPTPAERLAKPFGLGLQVSGVVVSSETTIAFAGGATAGTINGTTNVTLKGWIPPHPFELDGFIFGDTTTFDTKFALPATRDRITLSESRLKAGKFELAGEGLINRGSDHSEATLRLGGDLPCSALAGVQAESRLGKLLGTQLAGKAGKLAEKLIAGTVHVGLELSADTRDLSAARINRTIGVGCGLHPLSLAELSKLLGTDVNELLKSLPTLPTDLSKLPALPGVPSNLPALPSGIPAIPTAIPTTLPTTLPQLPNLGLPTSLPTLTPPAKASAAPASTNKLSPKPATSAGN